MSTRDSIVHGPETVSWRIVLDPLMMVAGVRALMLQALHPWVMWGVWQNSGFLQDPLNRLVNTADFVAVTTVGTPAQADVLGARVRAVHRRLRIRDPGTGTTRRVDEPEFLLWVHCAEVSSYLEVVTRGGGPRVTEAEADAYYDEQRHTAGYVGLHAEDVPASAAAMDAYLTRVRPELRVTEEASATLRFLLWPTLPPRLRLLSPLRVCWVPFGLLAYYSLPRWARLMYGALPELPVGPLVTVGLRVMRRGTLLIPRRIRGRAFKPETRALMLDVHRRLRALGIPSRGNLQRVRPPRTAPVPRP